MNTDQLQRGKELTEKLATFKSNLQTWEDCKALQEIKVRKSNGYCDFVNTDYIDFDLLKTITIASLSKKIKEAQAEFDAL